MKLSGWLALLLIGAAFWWIMRRIGSVTPRVEKIARAIAKQEGFFKAGSMAARNHNPGNMTADLLGIGIGHEGPFVIFASDVDGWNNLYEEVILMVTPGPSGSGRYEPTDTILQVAMKYTATQQPEWAANVAAFLGVTPATRLDQIT